MAKTSKRTSHRSAIDAESGPKRAELSHPPSYFVLVCGPKSETDPVILKLADEGFLTIRHTEDERTLGYDERAGRIVPTERDQWSIAEVGQIQPGTVQRDGDAYIVTSGRGRLKTHALLNQKASRAAGKFVEPHLFRSIVVKGTEEESFLRSIIENEDRTSDPPSIRAAKMHRAIEVFGHSEQFVADLFRLSVNQVKLTIDLLALTREAREEVDAGRFPASLAARKLTLLPRSDQYPTIIKLREHGIHGGSRAELALERLLDGKPMFDTDETATTDTDNVDDDVSNDATDVTPTGALPDGETRPNGDDAKKKRRAPNAPSRKRLAIWIERAANAAKAPDIEVPAKYQTAVDAALIRGARLAWQRQLGTSAPGWGQIRDVVEVHVEEDDSDE